MKECRCPPEWPVATTRLDDMDKDTCYVTIIQHHNPCTLPECVVDVSEVHQVWLGHVMDAMGKKQPLHEGNYDHLLKDVMQIIQRFREDAETARSHGVHKQILAAREAGLDLPSYWAGALDAHDADVGHLVNELRDYLPKEK